MEGDPFFEAGRGLEYLFGVVSLEDSEPRFHTLWAHDRIEEKRCGLPNSGPARAMRRFAEGTEFTNPFGLKSANALRTAR
jgi:hypothetical protein